MLRKEKDGIDVWDDLAWDFHSEDGSSVWNQNSSLSLT